ncbi:MAG: UxaA family hydrolase [Saprospiraceae bacterium]
MKACALKIHPTDNICVALQDLPAGAVLPEGVVACQPIPQKHKATLRPLKTGEAARMYGVVVGRALMDLPAGALLTVANLQHATEADAEPGAQPYVWMPPVEAERYRDRSFMGYHRADGRVGTLNLWLVIPLVFCENRNIRVLQESMEDALGFRSRSEWRLAVERLLDLRRGGAKQGDILAADILEDNAGQSAPRRFFPHVDGIRFLTHEGGCGGTRQDSQALCRLLAGYIAHPNVAGATVLSLGCQNAQIALLQQALACYPMVEAKPIYILEQQRSASERAFLAEAVKMTFAGLMQADEMRRAPAPLSALRLGLECGGSDGFSGISANPALGYACDLLVACGGSALLAEFPELHGVEHQLSRRCASPKLAERFNDLMRAYAAQARSVGADFAHNPSPGNIRDGLITDAMKSAGAARKGGSSPIADVLDYGEPSIRSGLQLLCTPGNDVESTTALAASGANIIAFTTGLGTPTGNPVAPVIKISSNTALAKRMGDLIDFDAGGIIEGRADLAQCGVDLFELIIDVASGRVQTAAMRLEQYDFIPWKRGVSL